MRDAHSRAGALDAFFVHIGQEDEGAPEKREPSERSHEAEDMVEGQKRKLANLKLFVMLYCWVGFYYISAEKELFAKGFAVIDDGFV